MAHARDPHKRVDVAPSSRHVRVELDGELLAESRRPLALFETTLPPRYYLPAEDVVAELVPSETVTMCPYKGVARYWSVRVGDRLVDGPGLELSDADPREPADRGAAVLPEREGRPRRRRRAGGAAGHAVVVTR